MHRSWAVTEGEEEAGRDEIFAGGKKVNMEDKEHALYLREEIVTHEVQHDLDKLGIAKTAREEKKRARDSKAESNKVKNDAAYDARMAQLYREVVLKEKPATSNEGGFIPLGAITAAIAPANGNGAARKSEEVGEPDAGDYRPDLRYQFSVLVDRS